jgi:hypothetical protein
MPESITETTEIIDSTPKRSTKTKTPVLNEPTTVWVLQNKYQGTITNEGVYGSEDSLLEAVPTLSKVDEVYQDCDQNGNGLIAFEMPVL